MNEEKITNFQKIKAMDIDEMAEFFNWFKKNRCEYCIYKNDYDDCRADFCDGATIRWLESEVRE